MYSMESDAHKRQDKKKSNYTVGQVGFETRTNQKHIGPKQKFWLERIVSRLEYCITDCSNVILTFA